MAVLLVSSLFVNAIQVVCLCLFFLPPVSRQSLSQKVSNTWWELFSFAQEAWCNIPFRFTGDVIQGNQNIIIIGNHERGLDFTLGVSVASRMEGIGCGKLMAMMKKSLQYIPTIGWTMWLQGSLFLQRNWQTDQRALSKKLQDMEDGSFPRPFCLAMYPEGTRITEKKKAASQAFAKDRGLPLLENVLLPRTKGFCFVVKNLPTSIDALYDITTAYTGSAFYLGDVLMKGGFQCQGVHIHVRKYLPKDLPQSEAELDKWLLQRFVEKDELLNYFKEHNRFPGEPVAAHDPPAKRFTAMFTLWSSVFNGVVALSTGSWLYTAFFAALQAVILGEAITLGPMSRQRKAKSQ